MNNNKKEKIILFTLIAIIIVAVIIYLALPNKNDDKTDEKNSKVSSVNNVDVISAKDLRDLLRSNEPAILLDVRRQIEYAEEHISGATNIELGDLEDKKDYIPTDIEIITMCDGSNCLRGQSAAENLLDWGFKKVRNFKGGIKEWQTEAFPTTIGIISEVKHLQIPEISASELNSEINAGTGIIIIDVRNSIDFSKGHIPAAKNINFADIESEINSNSINLDLPIVVYGGNSDVKVEMAAQMLLACGAKSVSLLNNGISTWENANYKTTTK